MNYFNLKYNLKTLYDRLEFQEVTSQQLINHIRKEIPFTECSINPVYTISLEELQYDITGCYYASYDLAGLPCIELEIMLPKIRTSYEISDYDLNRSVWNSIMFDLISVLGHEFVHMHQSRKRNFNPGKEYKSKIMDPKIKENQEYLGIPDEIDAYSFSAAAHMAYFLPKVVSFQDTNVYNYYTSYFKKSDPVVKQLEKKSKQYYNKLKRQYNETCR
jgi:hypothetical protein